MAIYGGNHTLEFWAVPPRRPFAEFLTLAGLVVLTILALRWRIKTWHRKLRDPRV